MGADAEVGNVDLDRAAKTDCSSLSWDLLSDTELVVDDPVEDLAGNLGSGEGATIWRLLFCLSGSRGGSDGLGFGVDEPVGLTTMVPSGAVRLATGAAN